MEELKGRIVCVDDDMDTCEMMRTLLGNAGYDVAVATTVTEGLSLVKYGDCDLILLNERYSDGTGVEMCQMIRTFDCKTPILFFSGAADRHNIEEALRAGAQGYLVKPGGIQWLEQTIERLLVVESHAVFNSEKGCLLG
jgi:two-component system response regulator AtoC